MQIIGAILILVVIGLYLLWLWFTKNQQATPAKEESGIQAFDIVVKGVYTPNVIKAKVGQPLKINFLRQESTSCSQFVNFPDFKIRKELPQGKIVPIEFTPDKTGEFLFTCDMSMYQGKLIIE